MIKLLLALLLIPNLVFASPPTRDNNYVTQTTIRASDVSANENVIFSYLQSGVDTFADNSIVNADINSSAAINYSKLNLSNGIINSDISSSAGIVYSKLTLTGSILNADLAGSISDNKLNAIVSTSKVGGTALTALASIPSAAGVIPPANLGSGATSTNFLSGDSTYKEQGYSLVSNTAVSGAANTGDIAISAGSFYKVVIQLGNLSAGDTLLLRVNNNTGGNYDWAYNGRTTGGALTGGSAGDTSISLGTATDNASNVYLNGEFNISSIQSITYIFGKNTYLADTGPLYSFVDFSGRFVGTPTSFRILTNGGATFSGNVLLYKLSTS